MADADRHAFGVGSHPADGPAAPIPERMEREARRIRDAARSVWLVEVEWSTPCWRPFQMLRLVNRTMVDDHPPMRTYAEWRAFLEVLGSRLGRLAELTDELTAIGIMSPATDAIDGARRTSISFAKQHERSISSLLQKEEQGKRVAPELAERLVRHAGYINRGIYLCLASLREQMHIAERDGVKVDRRSLRRAMATEKAWLKAIAPLEKMLSRLSGERARADKRTK